MRRTPFFYAAHLHRDLQHHHHAIKAVKTAPMARPSGRQLAGHSNRLEKFELQLRESMELRPFCGVKELPDRPARAMGRATLRFPAARMGAVWSYGQSGCRPGGRCCARKILAAERDFREQQGRLQEEIEARGHHQAVPFPKFHCELNPTEGYWCRARCLEGLRHTVVPQALASVEQKTICGFFDRSTRILEAYRDGIQYGCENLKNRVYKSHRRKEDRSTW